MGGENGRYLGHKEVLKASRRELGDISGGIYFWYVINTEYLAEVVNDGTSCDKLSGYDLRPL